MSTHFTMMIYTLRNCISQINNKSLTTVFHGILLELFKHCSVWIQKLKIRNENKLYTMKTL